MQHHSTYRSRRRASVITSCAIAPSNGIGKLFVQLPVPDQSSIDLRCEHSFPRQSLDIDQHLDWTVMSLGLS